MTKFRKRPEIIEAIQWTGRNWKSLDRFIGFKTRHELFECGHIIVVKTLEGNRDALPGDWIIKGVKGELYPCKPDIFEATYEAVAI